MVVVVDEVVVGAVVVDSIVEGSSGGEVDEELPHDERRRAVRRTRTRPKNLFTPRDPQN